MFCSQRDHPGDVAQSTLRRITWTKPQAMRGIAQAGTLTIPYPSGRQAGSVDRRRAATVTGFAQVSKLEVAVPVVGFVSDSLVVQREQFILVNKAKPLPTRLDQ
jgi:hypothetical protein